MEPFNFRTYDKETNTSTWKFQDSELPARPGFNTTGKGIQIRVNQFKVTQFPNRDIYQYDVTIGGSDEKMGKVKAVWDSKQVQDRLKALSKGVPFLWDGNKLAWHTVKIPEQRFEVNLDAEKGRTPRPGKEDKCMFSIKYTKNVRMAAIDAYISRQAPFESTLLEAISFLDHAMRQFPSQHYITVKRSFFTRGGGAQLLDNVIVAMKGVYSSMRLCSPNPSSGGSGTGLAVNVDVANCCFWIPQDLHQAARNMCKDKNRGLSYEVFRDLLLPVNSKAGLTYSDTFKDLRKMAKLKFRVKYYAKNDTRASERIHTIKGFTFEQKLGKLGANAKTVTFKLKDRATNTETEISVYDYFKKKYDVNTQYWQLPLVVTARDGMFPMEACILEPYQRYVFKLNPDQTSSMIKFAVTRPRERLQAIQNGINMLKWSQDPCLQHYGIKIDPQMTTTSARLLQNPEIAFAGSKLNPGTQGRWDLRGKKFLLSNTEPLNSWGFFIVGGVKACDPPTLQNFINVFIQTYIGHGGKIKNKHPVIIPQPDGQDLGDAMAAARYTIGNQVQAAPQIMFLILSTRDSFLYQRLKRGLECRFGLVSQMMNIVHVRKAQPQYCSNLCMKVNAKLGGTTCKIISGPKPDSPAFPRPTMVIGADVSHPSPGSPEASTAAITMSFDNFACRYAAAVQVNGFRVEMVTKYNIDHMFMDLYNYWVKKHRRAPEHIYYFRDGVSEGQYSHVLDQEVSFMKAAIALKYPDSKNIKWTVVICSKRHHIRFFPKEGDNQAGDRNSNPLPGTLVEKDVTHPFEYDFYLSSHSAIQGTARPVHYHVILDEAKLAPNDFQNMVYKHCYQYMRSTTPVSLYPAVYYAHLASNRARCHVSTPASQGPTGGQKFEEARQDAVVRKAAGMAPSRASKDDTVKSSEARPLVPLGNQQSNPELLENIRTGMWYI
ncbi:uncharacterized protein BP5553_09046 [Venustampulla echinocandica]|uniref:Piwi domain-containing protein n=1 Tax=Venustampulla echinocandica TaxID=2656787 RepID=A0A370TDP6_9HELO|nr:uncharacterized protein BP5553_09046 [Venustampulla echinocandica]RDL32590.1 hypothetical protein BP5553_09046 [Venustampulla echinocandica]